MELALLRGLLSDHVGCQPRLSREVLTQDDHAVPDPREVRQGGLDLAQLDTEAPQLHLEVGPARELDVAIGQVAPQITCAVDPVPSLLAVDLLTPGVDEEPLGGQALVPQIAARQMTAADVDLSQLTDSGQAGCLVENQQLYALHAAAQG